MTTSVRPILRSLEEELHVEMTGPAIVREHPSNKDARLAFFEGACRDVSQLYDGKPVVRYIGSDNNEDRHVSILEQGKKAIRADSYILNPVFAWAHKYDIPVIGNTLGLDLQSNRTIFDVEFLLDAWDLPNTANLARLVYRLVKDNRMPGSSVGFIPIKEEPYDAKDAKIPVPWFITPTRFVEWELLELSSVPIPSNRSALKKALTDHALSEAEVDFLGIGSFMRDPAIILSSLPTPHIRTATPPLEPPAPFESRDAKDVLAILKACGSVDAAREFLKTWGALTPEQRKGAVLNRRNASRLMEATDSITAAADMIGQVLDEAGYGSDVEEVTPPAPKEAPEAKALRESLDSLASDVQTLTRDIDTRAGDGQGDADVLTQLSSIKDLAGTILDFKNLS